MARQPRATSRKLRFEQCEDRRMLATMADIVILFDESRSALVEGTPTSITKRWLEEVVQQLENSQFSDSLTAKGITDIQYGLVGFGQDSINQQPRYAHSQLMSTSPVSLFGSISQLESAVDGLAAAGGFEDGWDAIEHAIAEYNFRDGAVPVFVLVQNEEGRANLNATLTRDGVLAALNSKNVILNSLVVGPNIDNDGDNPMEPLFDLAQYGLHSDIRVLGVEADAADALRDGQHNYHWIDTNPGNGVHQPTTTTSQALLVSYNGSNTGATGMVASGKSVLIGENLTGGIGGQAGDGNDYRAVSVPYELAPIFGPQGTPVNLGTGGGLISFSFDFYGQQNTVYANPNGTLTFGTNPFQENPGTNYDLSRNVTGHDLTNVPTIAVLWDDLQTSSSTSVWYNIGDIDGDLQGDLIVHWVNLRYAQDNSPEDFITFQAVLYGNGNIQINYLDIDSFPAHASSFASPNADNDITVSVTGGISATVGLWGGTADTLTIPAGVFTPGMHSINGSTLNFDGTGGVRDTNDSYVRMAWDTGGAAWDIGVVEQFTPTHAVANALRDAFIDSLGDQIIRAAGVGKVYRQNYTVVAAINYGGSTLSTAQGAFSADPNLMSLTEPHTKVTTTSAIDVKSNSVFAVAGAKVHEVFKSARRGNTANQQKDHIQLHFGDIPHGSYVVELFFAEVVSPTFDVPSPVFDVVIEGKRYLNNYSISQDYARINESFSSTEYDVQPLGSGSSSVAGVVKRFRVDVNNSPEGYAGLQIDLLAERGDPILNGLRVLRATGPQVIDVELDGSGWTGADPFVYSSIVPIGKQLAPLNRQGIDTLRIKFNQDVKILGNELLLYGMNNAVVAHSNFVYDDSTYTGIWTFNTPLGADKYRIELSPAVTSMSDIPLDGEWLNLMGAHANAVQTPDDFSDDEAGRVFVSGNGTPGGAFTFLFSVLPGDSNQDGLVTSTDASGSVADVNGDGISNDVSAVTALVGTSLPLRNKLGQQTNRGDYMDDEIVNIMDYVAWKFSFGSTTDLRADGSSNGVVDAADYTVWADNQGEFSAWYFGTSTMGSGSSVIVQVGIAPQVINVTISGSSSAHDPYSFDSVDGSGEQLRTVPVGGADTISITFSEDVNILASHLKLIGLRTANLPELVDFVYDIATQTATWRFDDIVANDHYLISLSDYVTDVEGDRLDGEWVNPASLFTTNALVSEFPSGNGYAGGNFNFVFTLLAADNSRDNIIDWDDANMIWTNFYWYVTDPMGFVDGDSDGNSVVDESDESFLWANFDLDLRNLYLLADLNDDGIVNSDDLGILSANLSMSNPTAADGDLNGDGAITIHDLDLMFAQYGLVVNSVA